MPNLPSPTTNLHQQEFDAMMTMEKIDVAAIEAAVRG
jgi:predicted 3-demethylubiquinone-9 3-methyltransferase (glyoxalase superfamily)